MRIGSHQLKKLLQYGCQMLLKFHKKIQDFPHKTSYNADTKKNKDLGRHSELEKKLLYRSIEIKEYET